MALLSGLVNRIRPSSVADGSNTAMRQGRYGEIAVLNFTNGTYPIADEGSYFKATNPTPGTGIAAAITTAFSATAAYFNIRNTDTVGGTNKSIYLDYLTLINTVVPATSTSVQLVITIDNPATARYSSGGSALTPVNPNLNVSTSTIASVHAGALVLNAASAGVRLISRGVLKGAIPVINDVYLVQFGSVGNIGGALSGGPIAATDDAGPIVIGPQQDCNIHLYFPANATTAGQWELEAGWWER